MNKIFKYFLGGMIICLWMIIPVYAHAHPGHGPALDSVLHYLLSPIHVIPWAAILILGIYFLGGTLKFIRRKIK